MAKRKDVLDGGPDNDKLLANDGDPDPANADVLICGDGVDKARVDATDDFAAGACENVVQ